MTRLALACLILAVAALTRSPQVVAWTLVGVSAVWLASYYLARAYRAACDRVDRMVAQALNDTEDPTALARAVGYHCLPVLTEDRVREESAPLVVDAEWRALNEEAS
jgi:hypothetical protein